MSSRVARRYVSGDFRFRNGYCRSNPRKMVKMWAEKEFRNLNRMRSAGIACPEAALLRQHVLVMQFIGTDGDAAPRLKVHSSVLLCDVTCSGVAGVCSYRRPSWHERSACQQLMLKRLRTATGLS
jgi:RIO1 family